MTTPHLWEADVILNDGGIATLRAILPEDREEIVRFYDRVSDHSKYLRFFGTHPELTEEDLDKWINTDNFDRVTLVCVHRDQIVGTARYEVAPQMLPERVADVSFLVQDDHHGKGVANILLEHLAQIGRENKIDRFFAEMLTQNRTMVQVFVRAGYKVKPELEDGFIVVDFPIDPTSTSREVMERRELRAEANSIRRLLSPRTVAVVGDVDGMQSVISSIVSSQFRGRLHVITCNMSESTPPEMLRQIGSDIDLVIIEYDSEFFEEVIDAASEKNAFGVVSLARGQNPGLTLDQTKRFVALARDHGLRALGPAALGLINTATDVRLNSSPAPMPARGATGLFTQSAGIATLALSHALDRGCGISSFIAAGSFGDVTGNDVIQYWADDENTQICLLSLDTIGNPRKFFRVLRRLALEKHVVVFIPSRALKSARHYFNNDLPIASPTALDEVIEQTGSMVVKRRDTMYDIAQLLARQPVPRGPRISLISNSAGLTEQMAQSAMRFGLEPVPVTVMNSPVEGILEATRKALEDPEVDAVLSGIVEVNEPLIDAAYTSLSELAASTSDTPLLATFVGFRQPTEPVVEEEQRGMLPHFGTYADALEALAHILHNEQRRANARPHPEDELGGGDTAAAKKIVESILESAPEGRRATDEETTALLKTYGLDIVPWSAVSTVEEAIAAAESYGWDVVLKNVSSVVRGRPELSSVLRHIVDEESMRQAWNAMERMSAELQLDNAEEAFQPVVQPTVKPGATLTIRAIEDPVLGPMVCAGIAGLPTDLLGDLAWRVPPLRRSDASSMVQQLRSAPLLEGYRGAKPANMETLEYVIMQLGRLKDDISSLVEIELTPVIAGIDSTSIVGARIRVAPLSEERDPLARSLK